MGKIYNIVLMSAIGNGPTVASETFFYDWTQLPNVPYRVSFTFYSGALAPNYNFGAVVYIDLGQPNNTIATSQNTNAIGYQSGFLGCLRFSNTTLNSNYYADMTSNLPTYLNGRPRSNNMRVQVLQNNATNTEVAPFTGPYTLTLSFEEI
jgi:hypothetical protein